MALDINYFKAIQNATGLNSAQEAIIQENKIRLLSDMVESINYKASATRNGILQPVVITVGKISYKSMITALPGDSLYAGDMIVSDGDYWLIVEVNTTNPIQNSGTAWLCNQLFRFQNGSTTIIERYGVLDNGNYATSGNDKIQIIDNKYKIYLPYDNDTKKLYVGKRLAINRSFDSSGAEILTTYNITSVDPVAQSYGKGGHLLLLSIESSSYESDADSLTEMICDYIASSSSGGTSSSTLLP